MFGKTKPVRNLDADEVARGVRQNRILLVDVREPNETVLESFPGAVLVPLSRAHPRSAGQGGGLRLPLRQAVGDGLAGGAGRGPAL